MLNRLTFFKPMGPNQPQIGQWYCNGHVISSWLEQFQYKVWVAHYKFQDGKCACMWTSEPKPKPPIMQTRYSPRFWVKKIPVQPTYVIVFLKDRNKLYLGHAVRKVMTKQGHQLSRMVVWTPQQLLHMLEVFKGSTGPGIIKLDAGVLSLLHLSTKPCCATQIDTVVYVHLYDYTVRKW